MDVRSKFFRSPSTIQEFDGDEEWSSESSTNDSSSVSQVIAVPTRTSNQVSSHMFQLILLEILCSNYVDDDEKKEELFKKICKQLAAMHIMNPLSSLEEMASVRRQYKVVFSKMMMKAMEAIGKRTGPSFSDHAQCLLQPRIGRSPSAPSWADIAALHTSRYKEEFVEIRPLGRGAYGSVYQARNKLDGSEYAVKKVAFQGSTPEVLFKIGREVQYLAKINHANVVRYCNSWIEHQSLYEEEKSMKQLPSITYQAPFESHHAVEFHDSGGIIFEGTNEKVGESGNESDYSNFRCSAKQTSCPMPCLVLYIQMELCCTTLKDWIHERNAHCHSCPDVYSAVDEDISDRIVKQILKGLHCLHQLNLIHRDVKPKNIFLSYDSDGSIHAKLGDLGLTRQVQSRPVSPLTPQPGRVFPNQIPDFPQQSSVHSSNLRFPESNITGISEVISNELKVESHESNASKLCDNLSKSNNCSSSNEECEPMHLTVFDKHNMDSVSEVKKVSFSHKESITAKIRTSNGKVISKGSATDSKHEVLFEDSLSLKKNLNGCVQSDLKEHSMSGVSDVSGVSGVPAGDTALGAELYTTGVGTTIYAAPEQLTSSSYDAKCDLYSVGLVMFEMFQPFGTEMERVTTLSKLRESGQVPASFSQRWPIKASIINKLISHDPSRRPSAKELLHGELFHSKDQIILNLRSTVDEQEQKIAELVKLLKQKDDLISSLKRNRSRSSSNADSFIDMFNEED